MVESSFRLAAMPINFAGLKVMQNPFYGYGTVRRGAALVGRSWNITELTEYLGSHSGSLSVIGEHRIGKSSLIWEVVERVTQNDSQMAFAWLDLSVVPDSVHAFRSVLDKLAEDLIERGKEIPRLLHNALEAQASNGYRAYEHFEKGLIGLWKAGINSLVVLDEFDALRLLHDSSEFVKRLRALIDKRHITGLSMVFISRRSLIAIEKQLFGVSNIDGVCKKHFVGPLHDTEVDEMLARCKSAWDVSEADKAKLLWYTGGHPYLAEMILCHGWNEKSVDSGVAASLSGILDHYRHLRNLLEEDGLYEQLIQVTVGPRWRLNPDDVERLTRYGIMHIVASPEGPKFRGWSEHFHAFLEKSAREQPFVEIWGLTENALRGLIQSVCETNLGPQWLNELQRRQGLAGILDRCRVRMENEQRHFGLTASDRLLEYSYPMDLGEIIFSEWQHFRGLFKKDKAYWKERFVLLTKVRNPSAHSREHIVPDYEMTTAQGYCKELLDLIR